MPKLKKKSRKKQYILALVITAVCAVVLSVAGVVAYQLSIPPYCYTIIDEDRVKNVRSESQDPAIVLQEAGAFLSEHDTFETQPMEDVTQITIHRAQCVYITVQDKQQKAYTFGETVGELLTRLEIGTEDPWQVSVGLDEQTYDMMQIRVDHVETISHSVVRDLQYSTVYCYDPSMPEGEEELLVEGVCGTQETITSVVCINGVQQSMTVSENIAMDKPTHQIVAVGTGENVGQERKYPLFGDKVIVTADGKYLYYSRVDTFEATGYSSWIDDVGDITACGTKARVGAVAVDPKVIPYFTKMYIVSQDGVYDYGEASAEDCGGLIKGKIIDLFFDTEAECWQFGRRAISVYFLTDEPV